MPQLARPKLTTQIFADRLREFSESRGTYSQIARDLGINRQQFARYLNGTSKPRDALVRKMAEYFEVDPGAFFQQTSYTDKAQAAAAERNAASLALLETLSSLTEEKISEAELPSGIYMQYRQSFTRPGKVVCQLSKIERDGGGVVRFKRRYSILLCKDIPGVEVKHNANGMFFKKAGTFMLMETNSVAGDLVISSLKPSGIYSLADRIYTGLILTHGRPNGIGAVAGVNVVERIPDDEFNLSFARMQGFRDVADLPDYVQYYFDNPEPAAGVLSVR